MSPRLRSEDGTKYFLNGQSAARRHACHLLTGCLLITFPAAWPGHSKSFLLPDLISTATADDPAAPVTVLNDADDVAGLVVRAVASVVRMIMGGDVIGLGWAEGVLSHLTSFCHANTWFCTMFR